MGAPSNSPGTGPEMMETLPTVTDFEVMPVVEASWAGVGASAGVQVPDAVVAAPAGAVASSAPPAASVPASTDPPSRPRSAG